MKQKIITIAIFTGVVFSFGFFLGGKKSERDFSENPSVEIVSIYDGDTITVNINEWPDIIGNRISVRVAGIDTPEIRGTEGKVKELARRAKMFTVAKVRNAKTIELQNLERDKYFRIGADVIVDGKNLSNLLLEAGLAKKYDGKTKPNW